MLGSGSGCDGQEGLHVQLSLLDGCDRHNKAMSWHGIAVCVRSGCAKVMADPATAARPLLIWRSSQSCPP
jgi:hypothetical protein